MKIAGGVGGGGAGTLQLFFRPPGCPFQKYPGVGANSPAVFTVGL